LNTVYSKIKPACVPVSENWRYIISTGITTASGGMKRVESTKNNQSLAPAMRKRLKP
jgi:hypothetical protein